MEECIKIGVLSDLHLTESLPYTLPGDEYRVKCMVDFIDHFLSKIKKEKVNVLVVPGDIVHSSALTPRDLDLFTETISSLSSLNVPVLFCSGNHDMSGRYSVLDSIENISSDNIFRSSYQESSFHDTPIRKCVIRCIDYCSHSKFMERAKSLINPGHNVLVGHVGVKGTLHGSTKSIVGIKKEDIEDLLKIYGLIILGHHHKTQWIIKGKALYAGSMQQTRIDETNHIPGGMIITFPGNKIERIENKFSPRFIVVKDYILNPKEIEGSIVKVELDFNKKTDKFNSEFVSKIMECKPYYLINPKGKKEFISTVNYMPSTSKKESVLKEVIDGMDTTEEKKKEFGEYAMNMYREEDSKGE